MQAVKSGRVSDICLNAYEMIARLQRLIVMTLLSGAALVLTTFWLCGYPTVGVVLALLFPFGHSAVLAAEFVTLDRVQRSAADNVRAGRLQLLCAWIGETLCTPQVFFWRQPFRSTAVGDLLVASSPVSCHGVLLVHGLFCNRGFWNPWMKALRQRGIPFVAISLEPVFGSIDDHATMIEAAVATLERSTGMPVVLVGHSMGGLAIRAWLRAQAADVRVRRVITIGTPHRGTWLARSARTVNGRQMQLASPWLADLAASEPAERAHRFTCFYGHCDNIVFPAACGMLDGATNIHVPVTAHVEMAFRSQVFDEVCRWTRPVTTQSAPPQSVG
jgi:triacylglycerol lipase